MGTRDSGVWRICNATCRKSGKNLKAMVDLNIQVANSARDRNFPRVTAVLTTRNEERFIAGCLENLLRQGVQVYLCDNQSTDRTLEIAQRYCGVGLIGFESIPHD